MNFVPKVTFENHQITETSITAFLNNKIYFFHEKAIKSYNLSTKKIDLFKNIENSTNLFVVKDTLCSLYANKLTVFSEKEETYKLKDIPVKIIRNESKTDSIGFLYENSLEIFNLFKLSLISLVGLKVTDIFTKDYHSYLVIDNSIFMTKNIFITFQIVKPVKIYSADKTVERLFVEEAFYLKMNNLICKFSMINGSLSFDYSIKDSDSSLFLKNYFYGSKLVFFGNAPFLIVNEEINNMFTLRNEGFYLALSPRRIYYIEEDYDVLSRSCIPVSCETEFMNDLKWFSSSITVNENEIKVPQEFIGCKSKYLDLEVKLVKYEKLLERVQVLDSKVEKKEHELLFMHKRLKDDILNLEQKHSLVQKMIEKLTKMSREVSPGDTSRFYELIDKLKVLLKDDKVLNTDYKKIFSIQRAVLKSKLRPGELSF